MHDPFDVSGLRASLDRPPPPRRARLRRLLIVVAVSVIAFTWLLAMTLALTGMPGRPGSF